MQHLKICRMVQGWRNVGALLSRVMKVGFLTGSGQCASTARIHAFIWNYKQSVGKRNHADRDVSQMSASLSLENTGGKSNSLVNRRCECSPWAISSRSRTKEPMRTLWDFLPWRNSRIDGWRQAVFREQLEARERLDGWRAVVVTSSGREKEGHASDDVFLPWRRREPQNRRKLIEEGKQNFWRAGSETLNCATD